MADKLTIQLKDVTRIYDNGTVGLNKISPDIKKGGFVVIIGLSGVGKLTLIRPTNRLHDITEGDILINGESITSIRGKELRLIHRNTDMISQSFNLVKHSSVLRNALTSRVTYCPSWKSTLNLLSKGDKQKAYEALQRVDMTDKVYSGTDELPGGQQQHVVITCVPTQNPKIILADEPAVSLDPKTSRRVMHDFKMLNEKSGMTVVANPRSIEFVCEFGKRTIGIRVDEVVYDGAVEDTPQEVLDAIYSGETKEETND